MKIVRFVPTNPPPPPPMFTMTFSREDGWALVMALRDAYERHPGAADRAEWLQWAKDLDRELRRDD